MKFDVHLIKFDKNLLQFTVHRLCDMVITGKRTIKFCRYITSLTAYIFLLKVTFSERSNDPTSDTHPHTPSQPQCSDER